MIDRFFSVNFHSIIFIEKTTKPNHHILKDLVYFLKLPFSLPEDVYFRKWLFNSMIQWPMTL